MCLSVCVVHVVIVCSSTRIGLVPPHGPQLLAETLVTQRSPCYSAVPSSLTNPLLGSSKYSPFCHTHYPILWINTSLFSSGQTLYQAAPLETNTSLLHRFIVRNSGEMQCLEEAEQQAQASVDVPPPLQIVLLPFVSFSFLSISSSLCSLS